jgi:hypothetical protein
MSTPAANTANCYIVDAPGYYMLPLVYGNAIKAGQDNPSSYSTTVDPADPNAANVLQSFLRHDDQPINDPYIYNNTGFASTNMFGGVATLVWMDAPELVTDVRLVGDNQFLAFDVSQASICQGNAVVAIRDTSGDIMWSWHIWVTPLVNPASPTTDPMINRANNHYEFMQYNLGWATATTMNYGEGADGTRSREIQVRITQTGVSNPVSEICVVTQAAASVVTKGNAPYYQWGRKDPLPPSNGYGDGAAGERQLWYSDAAYVFAPLDVKATLGTAIMHPDKVIRSRDDWSANPYSNLWDAPNTARGRVVATNTDSVIVKTVYDPNPAGFKMAPSNAWTRFSLSGATSAPKTEINASNVPTLTADGGYKFYVTADGEGPTAFYPIAGIRHQTMGIAGFTNAGNVYSALPATYDNALYMGFDTNNFYWSTNSPKANAMCVRPVTD